jgi:hypothetical protein
MQMRDLVLSVRTPHIPVDKRPRGTLQHFARDVIPIRVMKLIETYDAHLLAIPLAAYVNKYIIMCQKHMSTTFPSV